MSGDEIGVLPFEEALRQLDELIATLEEGKVPLAEAVTAYERGQLLADHCAQLLEATEARITKLVAHGAASREEPLEVGSAPSVTAPRAKKAAPDPGLFPGIAPLASSPGGDIEPDDIPF